MSSVQSVTHVLGLYRSRASSPGETPAGDDCQKNLFWADKRQIQAKNISSTSLSMSRPVAYLIVFVSSCCTLILELVAGRILAPFIGVSLYTWAGLIGGALAGT